MTKEEKAESNHLTELESSLTLVSVQQKWEFLRRWTSAAELQFSKGNLYTGLVY